MSRAIGRPTALKLAAIALLGMTVGAVHHPASLDTGSRMLEATRSYLGTLTSDQREAWIGTSNGV